MLGFGIVNAASFLLFFTCRAFIRNECIPQHRPVQPEVNAGQTFPDVIPLSPIATTKNGKVAGYVMRTVRNRPIAAFEGIPYAQPPVGYLRFRSPVPIGSWKGVREAKKIGPACLQFDLTVYFLTHGSEDCLYLNVYTPNLTPSKLLPVIVFIPGGAHFFGAGSDYGPAYLLDKQDVILVTFNYRLGILGYFTSGDGESPGNWGLKDQALLLRWVQKNIVAFGGNPQRITIAGQSAGGVSVGLHLMSPLTRDIPYAAITHSGHPFAFWGVLNRTLDSSRLVAQAVDCPIFESKEMMDCLRTINAYKIVASQIKVWKSYTYPITNFGPVVESPNSKDAFVIESVENAYANNHFSKVPVLMGLVHSEGDYTAALSSLYQQSRHLNREPKTIFPYMLEYQERSSVEQDEITRQVQKYFLNNEPITFGSRNRFSRMMGSRILENSVRRGMEFHRNVAPTYGFIFNYAGKYSVLEALGLNRRDWNMTHIDDLAYWLNSTFYFEPFTTRDRDYSMVEFITNVWGNFATKRKPVYTNEQGEDMEFWTPLKPTTDPGAVPYLLDINDPDTRSMIEYPFEEDYQFWKSLNLV